MRFCTEACFNFWTFGFYQRCCAKKNSYERWLDRSLVWVGKPPTGFNNQFRIFDEKMKLCQKVTAPIAPAHTAPSTLRRYCGPTTPPLSAGAMLMCS